MVVFAITAYNSHGYIHADEHYQIIEFANLKSEAVQAKDLPWEYHEKIRPALQPMMAYEVFRIAHFFTIRDPYVLCFILRMMTAIFALFCINRFVIATKRFVEEKNQKMYYAMSYLLWFIPYLSVRFSSECWSGLTFLLALSLVLDYEKRRTYFFVGCLLGLSFLFRFQSAFLSLGLILWLIFIKKESRINLLKICGAGMLILGVGLVIDYWFYGVWTCTFWNYLNINLIKDKASEFGTSSWYYYFRYIFNFSTGIFGIIILLSIVVLLIKDRRSIVLWITLPFLLVHSMIPHKEERFLFPIIYYLPIVLMMAYQKTEPLKSRLFKSMFNRYLFYFILGIFILANSIGLAAMATRSAGIGRMEITKYIHENYGDKSIRLLFLNISNPYDPWQFLKANFYEEKNMEERKIESLCELDSMSSDSSKTILLVISEATLKTVACKDAFDRFHFKKKIQSIPKFTENSTNWLEGINKNLRLRDNENTLILYAHD